MQAAHKEIEKNANLPIRFNEILATQLPHLNAISEDAIDNVQNTFVRKVCNTMIQEVISAAKQQIASKKRFSLHSGCQSASGTTRRSC